MPQGRPSVQLGPTMNVRFIVDADDSAESHTMFEVTLAPDGKLPVPHSHDRFDETFLATAGTLIVTIEGVDHTLETGDGICIKRGQVHAFRNETDATVRFVCVASPGIFGRPYFEELSEAFSSFDDGPPNPAVLGDVMRRHGLSPVASA